jgi:hypothetical protein
MIYYSVFYKTIPSTLPLKVETELLGDDYETGLLFGRPNKLSKEDIRDVIKLYLKENKIDYTELIITESKEITEKEYIDRTQYS